jgi:hypothetical protein
MAIKQAVIASGNIVTFNPPTVICILEGSCGNKTDGDLSDPSPTDSDIFIEGLCGNETDGVSLIEYNAAHPTHDDSPFSGFLRQLNRQ